MVNTLESSYRKHLRDKLGYAGEVVVDHIDQRKIQEFLNALQGKAPYDEKRAQAVQREPALRAEHGEKMDAYRSLRKALLMASQSLSSLLPEHMVWLDQELGEKVQSLGESFYGELGRLVDCIREIKSLRKGLGDIELAYAHARVQQKDARNGLICAMGLVPDHSLYAVGIEARLSGDGLKCQVLETAKWLMRKIEKNGRSHCDKPLEEESIAGTGNGKGGLDRYASAAYAAYASARTDNF